jgi:ribonuclease T1
MRHLLIAAVALAALSALPAGAPAAEGYRAPDDSVKDKPKSPPAKAKAPAKVLTVLEYVDKHKKAPDGYEGGRHFGNFEKVLPRKDKNDREIKYQEWDVNPHKPGVNRGAERLITGSDGSAHYTDDHYKTFTKIR